MLGLWMALLGSAGAVEVRLDLGAEDETVLDGFERATPWTAPAGVTVDPASRAAFGGTWPDPLLGDSLRHNSVVHLDLPPGTYRIGALFADHLYQFRPAVGTRPGLRTASGDMAVEYEIPTGDAFFASRWWAGGERPEFQVGETVWERQLHRQSPWHTGEVVVGEEGLDLTVFGTFLAGLVVTDASLAELEVELALVDDTRRRWFYAHQPPFDEDLAYATDGLHGLEALAWDERPRPGFEATARSTRALDVSRGQRLSGLLALRGGDTPATLSVHAPAALSPEAFEVTWMDAIEHRIPRVRPHVLHPLTASVEGGVGGTIAGGQGLVPLAAWAITVPDDAAPGVHEVRIVAERDGVQVEHAVQLRVRDLHLEAPAVPVGWWADLHGATAKAYGPDSEQARALWADAVRLMRQRGASILGLRGTFFPEGWTPIGGDVYEERLAWALAEWRAQGGGWTLWVDPVFALQREFNRNDQQALTPEALELARAYAEAGARQDVTLLVNDERVTAHGPQIIPGLTTMLQQLDAVEPDVPIAAAAGAPGGIAVYDDLVDHVFVQDHAGLYPDRISWFDDHRATGWSYNLGVGREAAGHLPWMLGSRGILLWHLNGRYHNGYIEDRGAVWQFVIPRPDLGHNLPLRRMEEVGAGIEDQRALSTLAVLVDELHDHRKEEARDAARIGCGILRAARETAIGAEPGHLGDLSVASDDDLDRLRDAAADQAERLARWSKRQRRLRKGKPVPEARGTFPEACAQSGD